MIIDLSNPKLWQPKYQPAFWKPKTYNLLYGGAGSGKSQNMVQFFLSEIINHPVNQNQTYYVLRKVASSIRNSVWATFNSKVVDWELQSIVRSKSSLFEIHSGTNKIVFLGCDDPEKLKSLSDAKYIWIEEATEFTLEDFTQITLRLRGVSKFPKRLFLTFNPISDAHWIKKRFFDEVPDGERSEVLTLHANYLDNLPKLDTAYITRLQTMSEINKTMYDIYALGEWGIWDTEKLFANEFRTDQHVVNYRFKATQKLPLYLSFDFNVNGGNTCVVAQFIRNGPGNRYWAHCNVVNVYRMGDLETLCKTIKEDYPGCEYHVNGDGSGHSGNELTEDNISAYKLIVQYMGLNPQYQLHVPRGNIRHISARLHLNLALKKCKISIPSEFTELINDLKMAKVNGKGSLDEWKKDNPTLGHCLDAFRYFISANFYELVSDYNLGQFNEKIEKMAA